MEARAGYHVIYGPEDVLDALPAYDTEHPPLEECARLFMNRGIGLLLARQKLEAGGPVEGEDFEFVVRNIYKALLAMGDLSSHVGQREHRARGEFASWFAAFASRQAQEQFRALVAGARS